MREWRDRQTERDREGGGKIRGKRRKIDCEGRLKRT